jgi:hypothetical protein
MTAPQLSSLSEFKDDLNKPNLRMNLSAMQNMQYIYPPSEMKAYSHAEKANFTVDDLFTPLETVGKYESDPAEMREHQQKIAVLHFFLNGLHDFMGINKHDDDANI